jgi:hypothetical protein
VVVLGAFWIAAAAAPSAARGEAGGADVAVKVNKMNKQALEAFDNLDFDRARFLLENALELVQEGGGGVGADAAAARTHLNLGMVLLVGLQKHDEGIAQFRAALTIDPQVKPPAGLFNPEALAGLDEARAQFRPSPNPSPEPAARTAPEAGAAPAKHDQEDAEVTAVARSKAGADVGGTPVPMPYFVGVGVGSGLGVAGGTVDVNESAAGRRFDAPGGITSQHMVHFVAEGGYRLSPRLMLSLQGRFQIVPGATPVVVTPHCTPSRPCQGPSSAIAVRAKATWFWSSIARLTPFVFAALGGGYERHVVKLQVVQNDCGLQMNQPCVDTVAGGPVLFGVGGGTLIDLTERFALSATLQADLAFPKPMLNLDLVGAIVLRL